MDPAAVEASGWRVEHDAAVPRELALEWRAAGPGVIDSPLGAVRVKTDDSSSLRWLGHRLLGRPLRCQRAVRLGPALEAAGVPCAAPLAALVHAPARHAVLVSRDLPGCDLALVLERDGEEGVPWDSLADAVARLHRAGLRQRDLKAPNVLVHDGAVALLDLDGVRRARPPGRAARRADLGRLAASLLAALPSGPRQRRWRAFLARYLGTLEERDPAPADVDAWQRATERRAAAKVARNRRSGRPLR